MSGWADAVASVANEDAAGAGGDDDNVEAEVKAHFEPVVCLSDSSMRLPMQDSCAMCAGEGPRMVRDVFRLVGKIAI